MPLTLSGYVLVVNRKTRELILSFVVKYRNKEIESGEKIVGELVDKE